MTIRLLTVAILLCGVIRPLSAQVFNENGLFYDHNWKPCPEETSSFYNKVTRSGDSAWLITDNYRFAGVQMSGLARNKDGTGRFGTWLWYYPNGQKSAVKTYTDDALHGEVLGWYENGRIKFREEYDRGTRVGVWKKWYGNGQLSDSTFYRDGEPDGRSFEWHINGQLLADGIFDLGRMVGVHKRWYDNGALECETNDIVKGSAHVWTWYDRTGRMTARETFEQGRRTAAIYHDADGTTHSDTARAESDGNRAEIDNIFKQIYRGMKYPQAERDNGIQGTVVLQLKIEEDGSLSSVEVKVPATSSMNEEAVRLIRSIRVFPRGMFHNKPGSHIKQIPIYFRLN